MLKWINRNLKKLSFVSLVLLAGCRTTSEFSGYKFDEGETTYFTYNESEIWYEDKGEGDTLLFVHGFGSSSYTWRYLQDRYSRTNRVICIDLKGFGASSKPFDNNYQLRDQTEIVKEFIKYLDLKDITMIGHSFGGAVVLSTYVESDIEIKSRIENLILIDSAAYEQKIPDYISLLRTPIINSLALSIVPPNANSERVLKELIYDDSLITTEMIETYGKFLEGSDAQHALIQTAYNIIPDDIDLLSAKYKDIPIPVLIIWGEEDQVIHKSIGERLHKDIKNSTFIALENCGHIPQEEYPYKTINIMDDFIFID